MKQELKKISSTYQLPLLGSSTYGGNIIYVTQFKDGFSIKEQ